MLAGSIVCDEASLPIFLASLTIALIVFGLQIANARSLVVCVLEEDWHFQALLARQTVDDRSVPDRSSVFRYRAFDQNDYEPATLERTCLGEFCYRSF